MTPTTLPSGQTVRGEFLLDDSDRSAGSIIGTTIGFGGYALTTAPTPSAVGIGGASSTSCPGSASEPAAAPGSLCFYITNRANVLLTDPYNLGPGMTSEDAPTGTDGRADRVGAQLYAQLVNAGRGYIRRNMGGDSTLNDSLPRKTTAACSPGRVSRAEPAASLRLASRRPGSGHAERRCQPRTRSGWPRRSQHEPCGRTLVPLRRADRPTSPTPAGLT